MNLNQFRRVHGVLPLLLHGAEVLRDACAGMYY